LKTSIIFSMNTLIFKQENIMYILKFFSQVLLEDWFLFCASKSFEVGYELSLFDGYWFWQDVFGKYKLFLVLENKGKIKFYKSSHFCHLQTWICVIVWWGGNFQHDFGWNMLRKITFQLESYGKCWGFFAEIRKANIQC